MVAPSGSVDERPSIPRGVAWVLFLLLLAGAFEWQFVAVYFLDLESLGAQYRRNPDTPYPAFPAYLEAIRQRIPLGASVALVMPARRWNEGYEYGFYRASYFLAGRNVIPIVSPDDSLHLDKLAGADYVAAWEMELDSAEFRQVWAGSGGRLLQRVR